jgi:exopolyphosphatase/guanosine-5'-triphosphate,3'-diphosphate pyrophosphatase
MGFGTSALRNAWNAEDFTSRAKRELDIDITIIPGEEEADLILAGVRQAISFTGKPMLVMDIGGGSIEFILATDKATMWKRSFEIGATRLLERFSPADPLSIEEHFRIAAHLDARLEPLFAVMDRHWPAALVGSAGSFDTLAELVAVERGGTLTAGEHTMAFNSMEFDAIKEQLIGSTRAERAGMKAIPEYRVDTLPLALIAIERVLQHGIDELHWSKYALKEGAAARMLTGHGPAR